MKVKQLVEWLTSMDDDTVVFFDVHLGSPSGHAYTVDPDALIDRTYAGEVRFVIPDEGYDVGFNYGYDVGFDYGEDVGYDEGHGDGYDVGFYDGRQT